MMILKDPLYGFISIEEPYKSIIETRQFQRLRNIKQLGLSYLIYPSANHSRFEHSIGAFYLAEKFAKKNALKNEKEFMAAALLHDVGHYPFSHAIENSISLANGATHEEQAVNIINYSEIADILKKAKMNSRVICDLIGGKGKFAQLISGQIDVDRLDYLKRDSYYTGVAYGVIESDIIIKNLALKDKKYFADEKYLPALESILISRYLMYSMVYMHRKTLIANAMLRAAFYEILAAGEIEPENLAKLDDIDLIASMRNSETCAKDLMRQIDTRDLYEEAIVFRKDDFSGKLDKIKKIKNTAEIEKNIAKELKIKKYEILINILKIPKVNQSEIIIEPLGKTLEKSSPMVSALNLAEWNHWFIGVYCSKKHLKKVKAAEKIIKRALVG